MNHSFAVSLEWTGNLGSGTSGYRDYSRDHVVSAIGKADIAGSADKTFHGDASRWNPEEMLIAALSQCHMLSFLHVAAQAGVVVTSYRDSASGILETTPDGGGRITSVTLSPRLEISRGEIEAMGALHENASKLCFIANSVNFPVSHQHVTTLIT